MTNGVGVSLVAKGFAVVGLIFTLVGAIGGIALRLIDPAPAIPDAFGFTDVALVGFEVMGVAFAAVGSLLVIRRPRNAIGWFMVVIGVGYGVGGALAAATFSIAAIPTESAMQTARVTGWLTSALTTLGGALFAIGFIFPTGRGHTLRWDRFIQLCAIFWPIGFLVMVFQPGPLNIFPTIENPMGFGPDLRPIAGTQFSRIVLLGMPVLVVTLAWSLVSRYRIASLTERQQLKWFALSIVVSIAAVSVAGVSAVVTHDPPAAGLALFGFVGALVPVAIGIAILRHRLYDIDRIISRTIAYAIVTGILGAIFGALLLSMTSLLATMAGSDTVAVATATLAASALFQPLRRRVQRAVDRRFDRSRYDASVTVQAMSTRLRDDVDLERVEADMLAGVYQTFRPAHASLWLRGASR